MAVETFWDGLERRIAAGEPPYGEHPGVAPDGVTPEALRRVPAVNCSWDNNQIRHHSAAHVSFAVAIEDGLITPVIRDIKRVSKPGRRVYMGVQDIPVVRNGLGVSMVSTPKGVMSDAAARSANVGGEVLCTVF